MANVLPIDANSLANAVKAGGPALLDAYSTFAAKNGYTIAVDSIVLEEALKGPQADQIGSFIATTRMLMSQVGTTEQTLATVPQPIFTLLEAVPISGTIHTPTFLAPMMVQILAPTLEHTSLDQMTEQTLDTGREQTQ